MAVIAEMSAPYRPSRCSNRSRFQPYRAAICGACRVTVGDEVKFACVDGPEFDGHLVDFDQAMKRQQMYKTQEGRAMLKAQEGATHHGGCGHCGGDN